MRPEGGEKEGGADGEWRSSRRGGREDGAVFVGGVGGFLIPENTILPIFAGGVL